MHSNSSWEEIPNNATCTTIPSLPLPPKHMWKHLSCPNSLEHPLGAIFNLTCHIFHISAYRPIFFHRFHSIFIIVVIKLGNLV